MNNQPDPYNLDSLHLTEEELADMRAQLVAHVDAHPLPIRSPYERLFAFASPLQQTRLRPFAYALAIMLMVGTGTAAAAESSLPGDFLYPMKVHVNERVQGALARSPEARAAFKIEVTNRRLAEAMITASATTTAKNKDAGKRLSKAAEEAEKAIEELEKKDPAAADRAQAHLEASMYAHEEVLAYLAAEDPEAKAVFEFYITSKATTAATASDPTEEPGSDAGEEQEKKEEPADDPTSLLEETAGTETSAKLDTEKKSGTNDGQASNDSSPPFALPPLPEIRF